MNKIMVQKDSISSGKTCKLCQKSKKKIVTYDNTLTPVLDDDYVPLTGMCFDVESANSYLSKSRQNRSFTEHIQQFLLF